MVQIVTDRPAMVPPPRADHGRTPPHNIEAEEALIGAMLVSREAIFDAIEVVQPECFYKPAHRQIFEAILELDRASQAVDVVTVAEALQRRGTFDDVGGGSTLTRLHVTTPAVGNARYYGQIVAQLAQLRALISVGTELVEIGYSHPPDVEAALDQAETKVFQVAQGRGRETTSVLSELVDQAYTHLEERFEAGSQLTGVASGFIDLDKLLLGLQPGAMLVLGARPAMGKSALALNMAANVAIREDQPVLYFSLEMGAIELTKRLMASEAKVDSRKLRTGELDDRDWAQLGRAINDIDPAPLYIDENPGLTINEIRAKARRLQSRVQQRPDRNGKPYKGFGLIVVDYLQLMTGSRIENRQTEVAEISRGLKILARELEVPVLALSQLSRGIEQRTDKRPQLSDLRESGAIEQDADVVMFIHREEVVNPDATDKHGLAELFVAKHRNGSTGRIDLAFLQRFTKFADGARD